MILEQCRVEVWPTSTTRNVLICDLLLVTTDELVIYL